MRGIPSFVPSLITKKLAKVAGKKCLAAMTTMTNPWKGHSKMSADITEQADVCCDSLRKRIANPEEEDRRSGRIFFFEQGKLEMYIEGSGEMLRFFFCPFCGQFHGGKQDVHISKRTGRDEVP